jgi:ATP-dependent exoDNAse (exonuclease V) beta subunit
MENLSKVKIIGAGAGSGKTYRLAEEVFESLDQGLARPSGIFATTYTIKAAAELKERIRNRLVERGRVEDAAMLDSSLIGTVHSTFSILVKRFAFELGLSPDLGIIGEDDEYMIFRQSLEELIDTEKSEELDALSARFRGRMRIEDWRSRAAGLAEKARLNRVSPERLIEQGKQNVEAFLDFFPPAMEPGMETAAREELRQRVEDLLERIRLEIPEPNSTTTKSLDYLRKTSSHLRLNDAIPWPLWASLAGAKLERSAKTWIEDINAIAAEFESFYELREDVTQYLQGLFDLAARTLQGYQDFKEDRGLLDFIDLEVKMLELLELPEVASQIQSEFDVLFVDEFQDTSPIQLDAFLKLSHLMDRAVWVGDPKQSIFAFRNAEPKLMEAAIQQLSQGKAEQLEFNWRSRPGLVEFANKIFEPVFGSSYGDIRLSPKREDAPGHEQAIRIWSFQVTSRGKKVLASQVKEQAAGIALKIRELLGPKRPLVQDPENGQMRQLQLRDIAILCRNNYDLRIMAAVLEAQGVAVAKSSPGLLGSPEARLVYALLSRIVQPDNGIAAAEWMSLGEGMSLEDILEDRLTSEEPIWEWQQDNEVLAGLEQLRLHKEAYTPAELLDEVIALSDLRRRVPLWGSAGARLANLEACRTLARQYESQQLKLSQAPTLSGLLAWFDLAAKRSIDKVEATQGGDSIQLLTYHKAKGLEWPMVICCSFNSKPRIDFFGVESTDDNSDLDLNAILDHRRVTLRVNPFGTKERDLHFMDRIKSELGPEYEQSVIAEEARLLYVGITRARDYLVLIDSDKSAWAGSVHAGNLTSSFSLKQWIGIFNSQDQRALFQIEPLIDLDELSEHHSLQSEHFYWEEAAGPKPFSLKQNISPSHDDIEFEEMGAFPAINSIRLGSEVEVKGEYADADLGNAIHNFLAADHPKRNEELRIRMAKRLLFHYELDGKIKAEDLIQIGNDFQRWKSEVLRDFKYYREMPLLARHGEQYVSGFIDELALGDGEAHIIDHKTFRGSREQAEKKLAEEFSTQIEAYRQLLSQKLNSKNIEASIYWPMKAKD